VWASTSITAFNATLVTAIWGATTRSLTLVSNIVNAILDEVLPGTHGVTNSVAVKIASAASATDPLLNPVPGAYAGGTAGFALGSVAADHTAIVAIQAKTDQFLFPTANTVQASGGSSATDIATAVWAKVIEQQGAITAQQALDIVLVMLAGVTVNQGDTFKTPDGVAVRVTGVTNSANERIGVILTPSA
jgi:hypothetical protein